MCPRPYELSRNVRDHFIVPLLMMSRYKISGEEPFMIIIQIPSLFFLFLSI